MSKKIIMLSHSEKCYGKYETFFIKAEESYQPDYVDVEFIVKDAKVDWIYYVCHTEHVKIPFDETSVTNYAKSHLEENGEKIIALHKRLMQSRKPSTSFVYEMNRLNDIDEMHITIPGEILGYEICSLLKMFEDYRAEFDEKEYALKLRQYVRLWHDKERDLYDIDGIKTHNSKEGEDEEDKDEDDDESDD